MNEFEASVYSLVVKAASTLPEDVSQALGRAAALEAAGSPARSCLDCMRRNARLSGRRGLPLCQDTGFLTFEIEHPAGVDARPLEQAVRAAVVRATREGRLRPNAVDAVTGGNSGDGLGAGVPAVHARPGADGICLVRLLIKGGGCENMGAQYSLPARLPVLGGAARNLDGVRKCVAHALWQAQGMGCAPGFVGVAVGSDRAGGYALAKEQLFRPVGRPSPDAALARLEAEILQDGARLQVGPMGLGGRATLLGAAAAAAHRVPASFFVSVSYSCWALRRLACRVDAGTGRWLEWVGPPPAGEADSEDASAGPPPPPDHRLTLPAGEEDIRRIRVGDVVELAGPLFTGRDRVHAALAERESPVNLRDGALYHCGPVVIRGADGNWRVTGAGPTTSMRHEPYQARVIERTGLRVIVGKGGMGGDTRAALQRHGAVYLTAVGGAAQVYADAVERVDGVEWLEFGVPEALWKLRVRGFRAVCTMDSTGATLHEDVLRASEARLREGFGPGAA